MRNRLIENIKKTTSNYEEVNNIFVVYDERDRIVLSVYSDLIVINLCNVARVSIYIEDITDIIPQNNHDMFSIVFGRNNVSLDL